VPCCRVTVASPLRLITGATVSAGLTGFGAATGAVPPPPPQADIINVAKRAIAFFAKPDKDFRGIILSKYIIILAYKFKDFGAYLSGFSR